MKERPTIWDWPLRLWHWAFALCVAFSLYSGLLGDIALLDWHQRSGLALLGLLAFRIGWGLWGGTYARLRHYRTTPAAFVAHFRRRGAKKPHTAPGIVLVGLLLLAVAVQVCTGLFATDDIFNEGPLHRYASAEFASSATWVHHRLHWLILGAVGIHLAAHAVYGLALRDPTPLAMITGRKAVQAPDTMHFWLRAAGTLALAIGVVWLVDNAHYWLG